jgi:hypothetical protein
MAMVRLHKMAAMALTLAAMGSLAGCNVLAALSSGKGTIKAETKLPANARVLVFVDPRPQAEQMSPDVQTELAEAIVAHLWKYKAASNFVGQDQLVKLRAEHSDLKDFDDLGVADVARATNADIVIHVYMVDYMTPPLSEGQITIGYATALVKVIDRDGKRLFPTVTDAMGKEVEANVPFQLNDPGEASTIDQKLAGLMALRIGRMFHDYDGDDRAMSK